MRIKRNTSHDFFLTDMDKQIITAYKVIIVTAETYLPFLYTTNSSSMYDFCTVIYSSYNYISGIKTYLHRNIFISATFY